VDIVDAALVGIGGWVVADSLQLHHLYHRHRHVGIVVVADVAAVGIVDHRTLLYHTDQQLVQVHHMILHKHLRHSAAAAAAAAAAAVGSDAVAAAAAGVDVVGGL
jgi:hypothetical protein